VGREGDTADHPMTNAMAELFQTEDVGHEEMLRARAAYFACIDYLDEVIGDFLAGLERAGLLDDTIVVYASDHGEMNGEHGLWWKQSWHEASTQVPFIVQTPDQRRSDQDGPDVTTPVSTLDLFPTLCSLTDVPVPDGLDGFDLADAVRGAGEPDREPVFVDRLNLWDTGDYRFRLVRDGRYKYIQFSGDTPELLFDIEADPLEQHNLAEDPSGEEENTLKRLRRLVDETMDFDRAETLWKRDEELQNEHELAIPTSRGNQYLLPDGRLVEAETTLYQPDVVTDDPGSSFVDWPDQSSE